MNSVHKDLNQSVQIRVKTYTIVKNATNMLKNTFRFFIKDNFKIILFRSNINKI